MNSETFKGSAHELEKLGAMGAVGGGEVSGVRDVYACIFYYGTACSASKCVCKCCEIFGRQEVLCELTVNE